MSVKSSYASLDLNWMQCLGNVWCKLNAVNLEHEHFTGTEGVYIIWHGGDEPKVVYVGQGVIRDRLKAHRGDERVQEYVALDLYVTWARVELAKRDGVERYLRDKWRPKVGDRSPDVEPIEVNSPW